MKNITLALLIQTSLCMLGCSNNDNLFDNEQSASNKINGLVPYSNDYSLTGSRAILENQNLSLSLCYNGQEDVSNSLNLKWSNNSGNWSSEQDVYLDSKNPQATIYAYTPYIENLTIDNIDAMKSIAFSVNEDQSSKDNLDNSDLLGCIKENVTKGDLSNGDLSLEFSHKLSLLDVALTFKDSYKGEKKVSDVKVNGYTDFTFDATSLENIVLNTESEKKSLLPYIASENKEYLVILPPQEFSDGDFISMTIDGENYRYSLSAADKILLKGNKRTILNLFIGNRDVTLGAVSVDDWNQKTLALSTEETWLDYASESAPEKVDGYYLIKTGADLAWIAKNFNKTTETEQTDRLLMKLNNDIDLSAHTWVPINVNNKEYSELLGNNMKIMGMNVTATDDKIYRGFFGFADSLIVKDVVFVNPQVKALNNSVVISSKTVYEKMGVLAGNLSSSFISNVHIQNANLTPSKAGETGGLVGIINLGSALYASNFDGCINTDANSNASTLRIGTFCGTAGTSVILGCYSSGEIKKALTSSFLNAFVGASVDLPSYKIYLDACYTTAELNGISSKMYVSVKTAINMNAVINHVSLTAPTEIEVMNDYIRSVYNMYDLTITGGSPKSIILKDYSDYYEYRANDDIATRDKFPYIMVKSEF